MECAGVYQIKVLCTRLKYVKSAECKTKSNQADED